MEFEMSEFDLGNSRPLSNETDHLFESLDLLSAPCLLDSPQEFEEVEGASRKAKCQIETARDSGVDSDGSSPSHSFECPEVNLNMALASPGSQASHDSERLLNELESVGLSELFNNNNSSEDELCQYMYGDKNTEPDNANEDVCGSSPSPVGGTVSPVSEIMSALGRGENQEGQVKVIKIIAATKQEQETDENIAVRNKKAAIQARVNRQKKKKYMQELEESVANLKKENEVLRKSSGKLNKEKNALEEEVLYLRSVLVNDSALSSLLKNIGNVESVNLSSSFSSQRKRQACLDHDYQLPAKKLRVSLHNQKKLGGGVCLHVDKDQVSLEFCSKCAKMANGTSQEDTC